MICFGVGDSPTGRLDHSRTGTLRVSRKHPGRGHQIALDGDCSNLGMERDQLGCVGPETDQGDVSEQRRRQSRVRRRTETIDESVGVTICGGGSRRNAATTERGDERDSPSARFLEHSGRRYCLGDSAGDVGAGPGSESSIRRRDEIRRYV